MTSAAGDGIRRNQILRPIRELLKAMRSLGLVGAMLWGLHTDETKHTHAFVHQAGQPWVLTTDADDAR